MPSIASDDPQTKSGIITSNSGERHIPSSVRPDGTQRREIKIRPGYRPPEDVEVYKNRTAEAWKTRGTGGVPGVTKNDDASSTPISASSNKNAKRREARKKAKAVEGSKDDKHDDGAQGDEEAAKTTTLQEERNENTPSVVVVAEEADANGGATTEKLVRTLKKKLRQAKELKEKRDKGDGLLPEQFEKVIKINELIRQLDSLGFDGDGEPKQQI